MKDETVSSSRGSESISTSVLERAIGGDEQAFLRMVVLFEASIKRWCHYSNIGAVDADDILQEVFIAVSRKLKDFRGDAQGGSFLGWIRSITNSKIIDYWRKRAKEITPDGGSDALQAIEQLPAAEDDESEEALAIENAILAERSFLLLASEFSSRDDEVFRLFAIEEMPVQEIAQKFQITRNTVYVVISKIRKRLREEFGDLVNYGGNSETD